jgi:hypothetical protein
MEENSRRQRGMHHAAPEAQNNTSGALLAVGEH